MYWFTWFLFMWLKFLLADMWSHYTGHELYWASESSHEFEDSTWQNQLSTDFNTNYLWLYWIWTLWPERFNPVHKTKAKEFPADASSVFRDRGDILVTALMWFSVISLRCPKSISTGSDIDGYCGTMRWDHRYLWVKNASYLTGNRLLCSH